jgi:4-hydroxythreonine-4-phosphate dehydrogenase
MCVARPAYRQTIRYMNSEQSIPVIAVTSGEPAGVGPELCARLAERQRTRPWAAQLVLLGDRALLAARAARIGADGNLIGGLPGYQPPRATMPALCVWHHAVAAHVVPGRVDPANAKHVIAMLESAAEGCLMRAFDALVTAPVHKGVINDAGIPFTGHTELFAQLSDVPRVVMMLIGGAIGAGGPPLRVALVTTHLPLAEVPAAITRESLAATLRILHADLVHKFGIAQPRIAVCGLNPHAGEGGHLGREEIEVIAPVVDALKREGFALDGPLPADTVFVPERLARYDCVLTMYHDQGLPVLKHASFGHGVNVTLGLPFIRTSVDHGTALDLAVDAQKAGQADPGSLFAAVDLAVELARKSAAPHAR